MVWYSDVSSILFSGIQIPTVYGSWKALFQVVARKLGKDEDEHVVASDAELDTKLDLFKSINETTSILQRLIEHYQDRLCSKGPLINEVMQIWPYLDPR